MRRTNGKRDEWHYEGQGNPGAGCLPLVWARDDAIALQLRAFVLVPCAGVENTNKWRVNLL